MGRYFDDDGSAFAKDAFHPHGCAMRLHELQRDREPKPGAMDGAVAGFTELDKGLDDARDIFRFDADPVIANGDLDSLILGRRGTQHDRGRRMA